MNLLMNDEFFVKYGIFIICGVLGSLGSLAIRVYPSKIEFFKNMFLSVIIGTCAGILSKYWIDSLEISGIIATLASLLMIDIVTEIREIIQMGSELFNEKAKDKLNKEEPIDKKEE